MLILAIDNSLDLLNVAVADKEGVLAKRSIQNTHTPSEIIADTVSDALADTGFTIDDVNAVFVTLGPGSFTGIRVSLAFCKGIHSARNVPLIGVPTLDILALSFAHMEGQFLCPLIDAKRGEVFLALYTVSNGIPKRLTAYQALRPESVPGIVQKPCICFGTGLSMCEPFLAAEDGIRLEKEEYRNISPEAFIKAGLAVMTETMMGTVNPIYGRRSEAEIKFNVTVD